MARIALVTAPGVSELSLEEISARKVKYSNKTFLPLKTQEVVLVDIDDADVGELRTLRTADDIFYILQEDVVVERNRDLNRLIPPAFKSKLLSALSFLPEKKAKSGTNYWVFVKQDKDQLVYRRDIASTIGEHLAQSFRRWEAREPADVELWVFYVRNRATVGLRLTDIKFRQRSYKEEERPGSLRPTLAASLVLLSNPKDSDYFLDPMCGVGTILIERALWRPAVFVGGGDRDEAAIELAGWNLGKIKREISIKQWDATAWEDIAEHEGKVTRLVCNLPFGKKFGAEDNLAALYKRALSQWEKLLAPYGSMTLLTSQGRILEEKAERTGLSCKKMRSLVVQGITTGVYQLHKNTQ